ncbi:hypothetical protein ABEB36_015004 [Hypothenemus hampei]|uniref:Uncharacterized protein n=1 Tax=Hypothenemus hampei TaxID=57062 RepID=A0ABD1E1T0_HYPHA
MRWLEENMHEVKEGEEHTLYINGDPYTTIRDSTISYLHVQTNNRQICERMQNRQDSLQTIYPEKRPWLEGHIDQDEEVGGKKPKIEEGDILDLGSKFNYPDEEDILYSESWDIDDL